jgi:uncharacterized membrane protein
MVNRSFQDTKISRTGIDIAHASLETKCNIMNVKRIFGTILTILGIIGLIYAGYGFIQHSLQSRELIVAAVIGVIFFISGIGLVKNTKDEA